jgi:hypothetical protein
MGLDVQIARLGLLAGLSSCPALVFSRQRILTSLNDWRLASSPSSGRPECGEFNTAAKSDPSDVRPGDPEKV